jgi:hypothetical protein
MSKPSAFGDLPADYFPFHIRAFGLLGELLWEQHVQTGPVLLEIPGFHGYVKEVVWEFANGMTIRDQPEP